MSAAAPRACSKVSGVATKQPSVVEVLRTLRATLLSGMSVQMFEAWPPFTASMRTLPANLVPSASKKFVCTCTGKIP